MNLNEITPIEEYNGIWYKRDDYFRPFTDIDLNGGKVRQCISLVQNNFDHIINECDNRLGTASSVHSPQGIIVARTAKEFGMKSILAIGNQMSLEKVLSKHSNLNIAYKLGCDVRIVSKLGYNTVLYHRLQNMPEKMFYVLFGLNAGIYSESIIDTIAYQTQNLPIDLDHLIITVGSGISAAGILIGLKEYNIQIKKITLVQISGYDRKKLINKLVGHRYFFDRPEYHFVVDKTYPYTKWLEVDCGFEMDGRYEAKAYDWMIKNIDYKNEKTLFWIIGNASIVKT